MTVTGTQLFILCCGFFTLGLGVASVMWARACWNWKQAMKFAIQTAETWKQVARDWEASYTNLKGGIETLKKIKDGQS